MLDLCQIWLRETYSQDLLGSYRADGLKLPLVERVHARMLLRRSANWLSPYHGEINVRDIIVITKDSKVVRACIIDHGDQPGDRCYDARELESALQERGLCGSQSNFGYLVDCAVFLWERFYQSVFQPLVGLQTFAFSEVTF